MAPPRRSGSTTTRAGRAARLRAYAHRANLLTSLLLIFPLFLLYQLAVIALPDAMNGADLITGRLIAVLGGSRANYLLFNALLIVAFVVLVAALRKRQQFDVRLFVPVVLESGIYALTMGALICKVMSLIGISPALSIHGHGASAAAAALPLLVGPEKLGLSSRLALSVGAGVHEELVFRLGMLPSLTWLFERGAGLRRALAIVGAFVISSLIFSAAHHVIGGEPWRLGVFTYRFFCGIVFASLFQFRGLAVAVYTHALYDIYVMLFAG